MAGVTFASLAFSMRNATKFHEHAKPGDQAREMLKGRDRCPFFGGLLGVRSIIVTFLSVSPYARI
jgi:hypothetical protein